MGETLNEYNEQREKDGVLPHVSLTKEGVVPKTDRYNRDALVVHDDKKYRVTHFDDICYNPANLKFGVICRNTFGAGIFSPIYVTFKVNQEYESTFIGLLVARDSFIKRSLKYQEGTVYERMAVKPEDLLNIAIVTPMKEEQIQIGTFFQQFDTLITLHQRKRNGSRSKQIKISLQDQHPYFPILG